jgi:hypothetical protein
VFARALIGAVLLIGIAATTAFADGDPASDVLLGENVFYPYSPPTSPSIQKTLNAETAAIKRDGFPLKVALIGSPVDLGVIPDLFGKPQQYANFLDQEISFHTKQPLLVVMSTGYGFQGLGRPATSAIVRLAKPKGSSSTALASAAIPAVAKLAAVSGHPVKGVPGVGDSGSTSSSSSTVVIIAILAAAAIAVAVALVVLRRRQATAPPSPEVQ